MKQLDSFLRCMLKYPPPRVSGILLACLLLFASCGGDDSSDESYAAIESGSFTFDETDDANNAVRVMANGAWQVYWEPASAAVTADPSSGVGNGTFRVKEMPRGTSVKVGVRTASGKVSGKTITVTRAAAPAEVTLSLAPAELRFNPAGANRITVTSNASWSASCPNSALKFAPASGTGDGTITVTAAPEGVRCTLTVTAGERRRAKMQRVEITYAGTAGYRWAELPATPADMTGKKIHTFWASTVTTKQYLRNYTYCYDTQRHCPLWIAHPQHACYQEGGTTRPATDPWARDPSMTETEQAIIYPLAVNNNRAMSLYSESIDKQWIRGHMAGRRVTGDAATRTIRRRSIRRLSIPVISRRRAARLSTRCGVMPRSGYWIDMSAPIRFTVFREPISRTMTWLPAMRVAGMVLAIRGCVTMCPDTRKSASCLPITTNCCCAPAAATSESRFRSVQLRN